MTVFQDGLDEDVLIALSETLLVDDGFSQDIIRWPSRVRDTVNDGNIT